MGKSRVEFGLIPVPLKEASSLKEGTKLTELLANHVTDFIQQSSFMDGLSYFFMANLPSELSLSSLLRVVVKLVSTMSNL